MTLTELSLLELTPILLFFISFFGLITSNNAIKSIVFTLLLQSSAVLFWLVVAASTGTTPPIGVYSQNPDTIADPLPQAFMLTANIIAVSVAAVNITMFNTVFRKYVSTDWATLQAKARKDEEKK